MAQFPMPCPFCREPVQQGDVQCGHCWRMLGRTTPPPSPGAPPLGQQVIYPKSKKYILMCVLAFIGWMIASKLGASGVGLISLATGALLWIQFKSSSITLDDQGFTHKSLGRSHSYKWTDINAAEGFFIVTQRVNFIKTNSFVGWNFDPSYRKAKIARAFSGAVMGTEAMIDPLGNDAQELAILMTEFMHRSYVRYAPQQDHRQTRLA